MHNKTNWNVAISAAIAATKPGSGIIILMPEYRPDISRTIAYDFNADFLDFRLEVMASREHLAHEVTIQELDDTLSKHANSQRLLAFNVETLLAIKSEEARQSWLEKFLTANWKHTILLPITIFLDDVPPGGSNKIVDLQEYCFKPQTLVSRLAM